MVESLSNGLRCRHFVGIRCEKLEKFSNNYFVPIIMGVFWQTLINNLSIEETVSMPGWVENPYSFMANADLFVLSSSWEGLANVLLEALACGCPVVSTDCPSGPSEILEDGRWGRLVPVNDQTALAKAIIATLKTTRIKMHYGKELHSFLPRT